jgi:PEP-CTERM motif-containing protein
MKQMVLAFACASVLLSTLPTDTRADPLYVADNEVGVPLIGELAQDFSVLGQILLPAGPITSVAAGPTGHVYASTATKVYDFSAGGTLLNTFSGFANSGFADLSFNGQVLQVLYVADNEVGVPLIGELAQDFSVLGQILLPAGPITSVSAGPTGHVYASTATKVYDFSADGTLLNTFSGFANSGFADLSFNGQVLYVADNEVGVPLIGELAQDFSVLGQILLPAGPITSVGAGPTGHVYASTATKVYDFSAGGTLLNTFSGFANSGFTDLSFFSQTPASAVPEPSTMMLLAIGFAGISGYCWQRRCKHLSVIRNLKKGIFAAPASMSDR